MEVSSSNHSSTLVDNSLNSNIRFRLLNSTSSSSHNSGNRISSLASLLLRYLQPLLGELLLELLPRLPLPLLATLSLLHPAPIPLPQLLQVRTPSQVVVSKNLSPRSQVELWMMTMITRQSVLIILWQEGKRLNKSRKHKLN